MLKVCQRPELIQQLQHGLNFADDATVNNALLVKYSLWDYLTPCDADNINILNACIQRWREEANKLYETTLFQYNPIENYDMEEKGKDKRTPDLTDETTYGGTNTYSEAGYDVPRTLSDKSKNAAGGKDTTTKKGTETEDHELRRHGNIGVTTTQQMIEMERKIILDTLSWYVEKFAQCFNVSMSIGDYCCGEIDPICGPCAPTPTPVRKSELDFLTEKVEVLEDEVNDHAHRIATAEDDIDALEGRMQTAEGDIDALEGRMQTAEGDIDALEACCRDVNNALLDKAPIITDTKSGAIATFPDGADSLPVKDLTITIIPVQSGTGDPSPSNPRPISGWTGANIYERGIDIWDGEWEAGRYDDNSGGKKNGSNSLRSKNKIAVKPSTTIKCRLFLYVPTTNTAYLYLYKYDKNGDFIEGGYLGGSDTPITIDNNTYFINFWIYVAGWTPVAEDKVSLNYPATETAYYAYNGTTYPITWQSEAGTVYGGTLDVTTGELTVTHANIASYAGETINEPWISSMDVYSAGATPTTGAQVVYQLTTPITYQLAPTEVRTLLGQNNIWSDTGDSAVTYRADTKLYIDKLLNP